MARRLTVLAFTLLALFALGCEDDPTDLDHKRKDGGAADAG